MNMDRINIVLYEMNKNKNYNDFVNLLSFEERKYIFYNIEALADNYAVFNDNEFLKYFFKQEEAIILYENINEMSDLLKFILGMNLNDELKKQIIPTIFYDFYKKELALTMEKSEDQIEMLNYIINEDLKFSLLANMKDTRYKLDYLKKMDINDERFDNQIFVIITAINDDNSLIEIMDFINEKLSDRDDYKFEVIRKFSNDQLKLKYLDTFFNEEYKLAIIETLNDDYKKIEIMKKIVSNNPNISLNRLEGVLCSLKDDKLKLENIYLLEENKYLISLVLQSLNSDILKLENMHLAKEYFAGVIISLQDDNLKEANLNLVPKFQLMSLINSFENAEKKFELISQNIEDIDIAYLIHADYLDKVKTIYPNIIFKIGNLYGLNNNNFTKVIEKYGYNIIKFLENKNITDLINLDEEEFNKTLLILDTQKAKQMNMTDVDNIIGALLQREFRFSNKDIVLIFSNLENFIDNKDINQIKIKLDEINKTIDINEVLLKYNINYEQFLEGLITGKTEFKNILHEITDSYIDAKRTEYLLENQDKVKKELNLEKSYEKNYLLDKMFKYFSIDRICDLLINLNKENLSKEHLELLSNQDLLKECLLFRQNPKEYKGNPNVKSKIKLLNQILNQLYLSKQIDYLGENDLNAKLIFNVKKTDKDIIFKIMQEIDIKKFKESILNNQELYQKLLSIMKTYHFLEWNDMFENLLTKADIVFDDSSIGILINYFGDFYPKLEEKLEQGKIKKISLVSLIDESSVYGSPSLRYKYLLGYEDYKIFLTNAGPNASCKSKEERLIEVPDKIKKAMVRKYITIPPINKNIKLNNNKLINVNVGNLTDTINLTYGERTGACMRIGGAGSTLFDFCLSNENGFHISFNDPSTNQFISRVSGFRNGNTVFLNQLRNSVSNDYSDNDLYEAVKAISNLIVESTKNSEYPIKNVVISDGYAMNQNSKERTILDVDPKEGFNNFYTDVGKDNAIYLTKNADIKLGPDNTEKYEVSRKKISYFTEYEDIKNALQQMKLIEGLINGTLFEDIELYSEEFIEKIKKLYIGEDWFIVLDEKNEIIYKHVIERDEIAKRKAKHEISMIEETIYKNDKNNFEMGGRSM